MWKTILMTNKWEFINKDSIKNRCECIYKQICYQIVDLLNNKKFEEAVALIPNTREKEKERDGKEELRGKIVNTKQILEELEMDLEMNTYPLQKQSLLRQIDYYKKLLEAYQRERTFNS